MTIVEEDGTLFIIQIAILVCSPFAASAEDGGNSTERASVTAKETRPMDLGKQAKRLAKRAFDKRYTTHELGDYLSESMGIIERLLSAIERDREAKNEDDLKISIPQAKMLLESFEEELDLIDHNLVLDSGVAEKTVNVREEGALGDGVHDDGPAIRAAVAKAVAMGSGARVFIPAGIYIFAGKEKANAHLYIVGVRDLTIEGEDSTLLIMKTGASSIRMHNCRNLRIRNLAIDYDPIPFSQGTIAAINEETNSLDIDLWDGYPDPSTDAYNSAGMLGGIMVDPVTKLIDLDVPDPSIREIETIGDNRYRVYVTGEWKDGGPFVRGLVLGKAFVIHPRGGPGGHGFVANGCEYCIFDRVRVYSTRQHTFVGGGGHGLKYIRCSAEPKPGTDRLACNNSDGINLGVHLKGPYLESCRMRLTNDDCFNCYSIWSSIGDREGDSVFTIAFTRADRWKVGTLVVMVNSNNGERVAVGSVVSSEPAEYAGSEAAKIRLDCDVKGVITLKELPGDSSGTPNYIMYEGKTPHFIINPERIGSGIVIRNCDLGYNRSAGLKIQCPNSVVRGNTLSWHQLQCIRVESLLNWGEGFFPENAYVVGNTFRNKKRYLRSAFTLPGGKGDPGFKGFRNVIFEDNIEIDDMSGVTFD